MPGFNQKGPMGQGPMTGRRMGRCANAGATPTDQTSPENKDASNLDTDNLSGRGLGSGRGRGGAGRGMGRQNRNRGGQ